MGDIYTQYPGDQNQYPKGTPQDFPYPSQTFQQYSNGEIIGQSSSKINTAPIIVTSGTLKCQTYNGVKQAFTDTYNFRALLNGMDNQGKRVGWTNSIMNAIVTPVVAQPKQPSWAGIHLFARYRTEYDLYVASFRFDGLATIKKKIAGTYTTLAQVKVPAPKLGQTYTLQFTCNRNSLSYFINGTRVLSATDADLGWGTTGLRTDYTDCYIQSLRMTTPKQTEDGEADGDNEDGDNEDGDNEDDGDDNVNKTFDEWGVYFESLLNEVVGWFN